MNDKTKPGMVSKWWRQVTTGGTANTDTRYCEKGHPMDPNWSTCAYCDAESRANQRTASPVMPENDEFRSSENLERSKNMGSGTTRIDTGSTEEPHGTTRLDTDASGGSRGTRIDAPDPYAEQPKKRNTSERKITGVLATFSWRYQGELFVLYEGRNVIGSAASCDIQVTSDPSLSGEHAVVLCRAGRDELHDLLSTNGTFLNEKYVERDGADIADKALIKTGGTVFEFRKITSGAATGTRSERPAYVEDDTRPRRPGETAI